MIMKHTVILLTHLVGFTAAAILLVQAVHSQVTWDFIWASLIVVSMLGGAVFEYREDHHPEFWSRALHHHHDQT